MKEEEKAKVRQITPVKVETHSKHQKLVVRDLKTGRYVKK